LSAELTIGKRSIGTAHPPFVIAELSGNHNRSLERAIALVEAAASAGADAIKLQTYTADTLTMPGVHRIDNPESPWNGRELHELYAEASTPWEWHETIFTRAQQLGMLAFSSPFDESAVDFLETLDVPAYKIASFENEHYPLIRKAVASGKPLIMSTGVIGRTALDESVSYLRKVGCTGFALLKCTSTYPASTSTINLHTIADLRDRYHCHVGLSDHTLGIGVPVAAVALGARIIEKHLTLCRADGGVDSSFSLEPGELAALVTESHRAWEALGKVTYDLSEKDQAQIIFKRSIYAARALPAGHRIGENDLRVIRPSNGLHPRHYERILGLALLKPIGEGEPLREDHLP